MPSIRETLQELGVSVDQVMTELAQKSIADTNNGTVPTPLTNYLDVRNLNVIHWLELQMIHVIENVALKPPAFSISVLKIDTDFNLYD